MPQNPRDVLSRYTAGPKTGVFTDGSCEGNPGPGGWGFVWVENDVIRAEACGHAPATTNKAPEPSSARTRRRLDIARSRGKVRTRANTPSAAGITTAFCG